MVSANRGTASAIVKRRWTALAAMAIAAALLCGAVAIARQARVLRNRAARQATLEGTLAAAEVDVRVLTQQLRDAERNLRAANEQAQKLASPHPAAEAELTSWTNRVARLRKRFAERPDLAIPELRYALPKDWLDATVDPALTSDSDYRKAMSRLRMNAKARFGAKVQAAVERYRKTGKPDPVTDLSQLAPYFSEPVAPEILARYRPAGAEDLQAYGMIVTDSHWRFVESSSTDKYYDSTVFFTDTAYGVFPTSPYQREVGAAADAYANSHNGVRPKTPEELAPYLNSPIDPEFVREQLNVGDAL